MGHLRPMYVMDTWHSLSVLVVSSSCAIPFQCKGRKMERNALRSMCGCRRIGQGAFEGPLAPVAELPS